MFWGCFNGSTKGPCLFWEKEWGTIKASTATTPQEVDLVVICDVDDGVVESESSRPQRQRRLPRHLDDYQIETD